MSNIMQYLIQMSDEFRDSYEEIDKKISDVMDRLTTVEMKLSEVEIRLNPNRNDEEN